MTPGRSAGGGRGGRGGRGRGRGRGGGRGSRGRGGSSGRGTALPSSLRGRGEGRVKGGDRRRRGGGDAAYDDDGDEVRDRHKYDAEAGDSDDGPGPEDSDFEDEEVDEDAAFDSADEARYGELMDTILQRRSGGQGGGGEEDEDESDDEFDDGGVGMSVMDMLAANEAAEEARKVPLAITGKGKRKGKSTATGGGAVEDSRRTAPTSEVSSADASEDEAGLEGDAMDEDLSDEGGASDEPELDDDSNDDDDDDDEDDDERHARLMGFVETLGDQAAAARRAAEDRRSSQLLKEGEFNVTAVATAGVGLAASGSGGGVTMETLMGSLQNSKGFAAVKKQVAAFSGKSGAPTAPVSKTAELRAERETAYDSRKSDMGKWVAPVQTNRKAETLDFTRTVKTNLSNAALASKMHPTTDMEKEVEMLLTAGGASEAGLAEKEMEELKSKAYTVEEVKERQAELSKMRALMFYQERKQHHMNKIKSKVYRKIKKRQRDRAGDVQEADGEVAEVAARKRAEERMSLRHKNTTKWVKHALRAKGGAGKDDRKAIAEQLKLGQELRAKVDGVDDNSSDDDSSSEEEGRGESETGTAGQKNKKRKLALSKADREELEGIGGADKNEDGLAAGAKGAALLKMAFMQKAMVKQRERAREEASVLLRELEEASAAAAAEGGSSDDETRINQSRGKKQKGEGGEATPSSWEEGDSFNDIGGGVGTRVSKETQAEAAAEVAKTLPPGALQSSAVGMDPRLRSSVASPLTIDLGGGMGGSSPVTLAGVGKDEARDRAQSPNKPADAAKVDSIVAESKRSKKRRQADADGVGKGMDVEEEEKEDEEEEAGKNNPWLAPTSRRSKERRRASNGEVLLDVRKAAATALSAFAGATGDDSICSDANGNGTDAVGQRKRKIHATDRGTGSTRAGGEGKSGKPPPNERAVQGQGAGPKRRRRRKKGGGGDGDDGRLKDPTNGGTKEESTKTAATAKETGGKKKANTAKVGPGKGEEAAGTGQRKGGQAPPTTARLVGLSNDELVRRAFAAPDFASEFKESKDGEIEAELAKGREKLPGTLKGWGSWAGDGVKVPRGPTKRQVLAKEAQAKKEEAAKRARKDDRLPTVVLNEKRQKRSAKYMVSDVPYPFTSREQYERSLRQPIGGEWNTSQSVRAMTRPAVVVRAGVAVTPMKLGKLHRDNAKERESESAAKGAKGAKQDKANNTRGGARRRRGKAGGR